MLNLSRKEGERIYVGENICIVVSRIRGNVVQIGIDAPRSVPINREELLSPESRWASPELEEKNPC